MKLLAACVIVCAGVASIAPGAVIAIDALRAGEPADILATGSSYSQFRGAFAGNTLVPLTHFGTAELAGVDAIVCRRQYTSADGFAPDELAAIHGFVTRGVFVSDSSLWSNTGAGSDYPISYGDNLRLLTNIISYIGVGHGALFIDDGGFSSDQYPMSALMGPYGINFDNPAISGSGQVVTGFVPHELTAGVSNVGVDYHRPLGVTLPSMRLTTGADTNNILAVLVPAPGAALWLGCGVALTARRRR